MKNIFLLLIILLLTGSVYAQQQCFNENYKLSKRPPTIAVVPLVKNEKDCFRAMYKSLKSDSLKNINMASIEIVYNNMLNNMSLKKWLDIITKKEFPCAEVKQKASIAPLIGEDMKNMVKTLDNADLVIVVTDYKETKAKKPGTPGTAKVTGRFRMYDLITGDVILDYKAEQKLPYTETDPRKFMEALAENFHAYYIKNFVARNAIN